MSSAAARSESGAGPATAHELAMQQPPQQQEVVAAAAEVQAPPPGSVVVAAAEVPAPVVVATAEVPAQAPGAVLTIVISKPEEEEAREQKGVAPASLPPLEVGDASAMVAVAAAKEAELARSDSFDEQCRYTVGGGSRPSSCETSDVSSDPAQIANQGGNRKRLCGSCVRFRTDHFVGKLSARASPNAFV